MTSHNLYRLGLSLITGVFFGIWHENVFANYFMCCFMLAMIGGEKK